MEGANEVGGGSLKEGKALSEAMSACNEEVKAPEAPGYKLATISELAQYVKENNQLPPSPIQGQFALDGESNNLVKQQYYLLEKLEEQAIYIIQLQDQINQLNLRLQALEPSPSKPSNFTSLSQIPQK